MLELLFNALFLLSVSGIVDIEITFSFTKINLVENGNIPEHFPVCFLSDSCGLSLC